MPTEHLLLDAVRLLHGCDNLDDLAGRMIGAARSVVSCDTAVFTEVNVEHRRAVHLSSDTAFSRQAARLNREYERFVHQHPLVVFALRDPEPVTKFSDFITLRELRRLGLYKELLEPLGVARQIGVCLSAAPELAVGVALNRAGRDFSERDRRRLALLRPHLREAYQAASLRAGLSEQLSRQDLALGSLRAGLLVVDAGGRIETENAGARAALLAAFPDRSGRGNRLPEPLRVWLAAALRDAARIDRPKAVNAAANFTVMRGRLRVRLLLGEDLLRVTLLLRFEDASQAVSCLHRDGLTRREAEVLSRLALGETNAEIARGLAIRPGTAKIHVERILGKLAVTTRTAAARVALSWLNEA